MPTPVPSCALLFRGGELLSFARRCDRSGPLQRLGHEQPRHARAGDDNPKFAISHHTSQDGPDLRQPKCKPAAAVRTTQVSIADRGVTVL